MKIITAFRMLFRRITARNPRDRLEGGYVLLEGLARVLAPAEALGERGKIWMRDREFLDFCRRLDGDNLRSAERKYFLRSLAGLVRDLPGDTAECGVFRGTSSCVICAAMDGTGKEHHGFDSFEGLPDPGPADGEYWKRGDLRAAEAEALGRLAAFPFARLHAGVIPARFPEVADRRFSLVHVDVDLYRPTIDSLEFFYPRMVPGGVIVGDDYGFDTCPGARRAFDEFMAGKPERLVPVPTGQAFVVKR